MQSVDQVWVVEELEASVTNIPQPTSSKCHQRHNEDYTLFKKSVVKSVKSDAYYRIVVA